MKVIDNSQYKTVLLGILHYINDISERNGIKYTLVGGSLIGAVREGGIIPWDDDIDIGLLPDEYDKLIEAIKKDKNPRYIILDAEVEHTYYYPFAKVIDTKTTGYEIGYKKINGFGAYVDVFKYNELPNDDIKIDKYYKKRQRIVDSLFRSANISNKSAIKSAYHKLMSKRDSNRIAKKHIKFSEKYNRSGGKKCMINWTPYGAKRETHDREIFSDYRKIDFDGVEAMIVKDYDVLLRRTFGDYMTPPPKEKQITHHHMKMYWK